MEGWIQEVKDGVKVSQAVVSLRLQQRQNTFGPCPACTAERRGKADDRLPCGWNPGDDAWTCHACSTKGDVVELLARGVLGEEPSERTAASWAKLREWLARERLLTGSADAPLTGRRGNAPTVGDLLEGMAGGRPRARPSEGGRSAGPGPAKSSTGPDDPAPARPPGGRVREGTFAWRDDLVDASEAALWSDATELGVYARGYLAEVRRLPEASVREFRLGLFVGTDGALVVTDGRPWIVIPLLDPSGRVVNARFRSVPVPGSCPECNGTDGCKDCKRFRVCAGRKLPLYGAHRLSNDSKLPVLVTEGELDVVAMHAYGFEANVVSGTGGAKTFAEDWLDALEPYEQIVGLYDADADGVKGWDKAVEKLGVARCSRATLPKKDAGDCLRAGIEREVIERAIGRAEPMHGYEAVRVDFFRDLIKEKMRNPEQFRGTSTTSAAMDEVWGGIRPGVVVVTGETGTGKTSLITWLFWQLATVSDESVMLTSFEQRPDRTVEKLLRMECGRDFSTRSEAEVDAAFDRLRDKPIRILNHFGYIKARKMMEIISYHARRDGVRRFLIDHIGHLIDPDADDERRAYDAVVRALFVLAHQLGVTLFVICHPHNMPPGQKVVTPRDLKGSSAIRQDMDDILSVEPLKPDARTGIVWPRTRVHFMKVRSEFGGAGGKAVLAYDTGSCIFADRYEDTPAGRDGLLIPRRMPEKEGA